MLVELFKSMQGILWWILHSEKLYNTRHCSLGGAEQVASFCVAVLMSAHKILYNICPYTRIARLYQTSSICTRWWLSEITRLQEWLILASCMIALYFTEREMSIDDRLEHADVQPLIKVGVWSEVYTIFLWPSIRISSRYPGRCRKKCCQFADIFCCRTNWYTTMSNYGAGSYNCELLWVTQ